MESTSYYKHSFIIYSVYRYEPYSDVEIKELMIKNEAKAQRQRLKRKLRWQKSLLLRQMRKLKRQQKQKKQQRRA